MDMSLIRATADSIGIAIGLGKTALGLRDWNKMAAEIAKMNDELMKAQNAALQLAITASNLHAEVGDARAEIVQLKGKLEERGRYALFEIGAGKFAYRSKSAEMIASRGMERDVEPLHFLCQPCFDAGRKMVLQLYPNAADGPVARCPHCREFFNAERGR